MTAEEKRAQNRKDFPRCTEFVDAMKEQFGAEHITVTYVAEGGKERGERESA